MAGAFSECSCRCFCILILKILINNYRFRLTKMNALHIFAVWNKPVFCFRSAQSVGAKY